MIELCRVNPYKQVYRVLKFAWHHKIPVRRSAFTYCEDEWPSRLDLGKENYGGQFTLEQNFSWNSKSIVFHCTIIHAASSVRINTSSICNAY